MAYSVGSRSGVGLLRMIQLLSLKFWPRKNEKPNTNQLSYDFGNSEQVLAQGKKILILAPHNDDEALMCAGIITHALNNGAVLRVVVVTNGDKKGRKVAFLRMRETIKAMTYLGLKVEQITFLGYGDTGKESNSFLNRLYHAENDNLLVASAVGDQTYGLPELPEYHFQKYGVHGRYDRVTFRQDLEAVIKDCDPDHIFVSSLYDTHPDHSMLNRFTVETIVDIKRNTPGFSPVMHEYLIHSHDGDDDWPSRDEAKRALRPYSKPVTIETHTPLNWEKRERFTVPLTMQRVPLFKNPKYIAISKYRSQRPSRNRQYLYSYVKQDEFFWEKDFSNIAYGAKVTVSSENKAANQLGINAINGFYNGMGSEWVTIRETAGAWISLSWPQFYTVNKIILYGRVGPQNHITSATFDFSDGSSIRVGALPENGYEYEMNFKPKRIEWVKLTIDSADGENTGLSEFEVYEAKSVQP